VGRLFYVPKEFSVMRSKKYFYSLLLGVRRLLTLLANAHPLIFTVTPRQEEHHEQYIRSTRY
jgi:hypothetical protein